MTQHEKIIQAVKEAKERNAELAMSIFKTESVVLMHAEGFNGSDNTIQSSLQAMTCHGYFYSESELERVLRILANIK